MFYLLYTGFSIGSQRSEVRHFAAIEAARSAMRKDFDMHKKLIKLPDGIVDDENKTVVSEDSITVNIVTEDGPEVYAWAIKEAVCEDAPVPETISVKGENGTLIASVGADADYPEIYLEFIAATKPADMPDRQVARFGFDDKTDGVVLQVWGDDTSDDVTATFHANQCAE